MCSDCEAYGLKKHGLTRSDCISLITGGVDHPGDQCCGGSRFTYTGGGGGGSALQVSGQVSLSSPGHAGLPRNH